LFFYIYILIIIIIFFSNNKKQKMSSDLFRNQKDSNSKPIPIPWLGSTREHTTIPNWLSGVYFQIGPGYLYLSSLKNL